MKKVISILLSAVLLFCGTGTLFASALEDDCDCGYDPIIYVIGFASRTLVLNQGKEDEMAVFTPSTELFTQAAENLLKDTDNAFDVASFLATGNYSYLSNVLDKLGNEIFKYIEMDTNGKSIYDVTERDWSYPSEFQLATHDKNTEYDFYYDWRDDPFTVAAELNEYIDYILEGTGHDKVNLIGFSLGSAQVMTYLYEYGYDKVAGVELRAPAFNGVSVAGQPLSKKVTTDSSAIIRVVDAYMEESGMTSLILTLLTALEKTGIIPGAVSLLTNVIDNCIDDVYAARTGKIFGTIPGLWALVADDDYEAAKEALLPSIEGSENFEKIIDHYHYDVQCHNKDIIDGFMAQGGKFCIVVKYGSQIAPAGQDYNNQADGVIDTKYESFGATCAPLGETLGDDYVQAIDDGHNHISPDNAIDASTCVYPEYTWFVKGSVHPYHCDYIEEFTHEFFYADTQWTVWSNANYPQFVVYNESTEETSTDFDDEDSVNSFFENMFGENSWAMVLVNFIRSIIRYITELFSK